MYGVLDASAGRNSEAWSLDADCGKDSPVSQIETTGLDPTLAPSVRYRWGFFIKVLLFLHFDRYITYAMT
jgi:hypothetical protein